MIVAERLRRFDTIGIDCVAMNVNDLICVGAEPVAMVDFILCERADPEGLRRDRRRSAPRGRAGRDRDPRRRDRPGRRDRERLGARGDGYRHRGPRGARHRGVGRGGRRRARPALVRLHSNGYTLARQVLADLDLAEDPDSEAGPALGDVLLEPTEIYVRAVLELLRVRGRGAGARPHHGRRAAQLPGSPPRSATRSTIRSPCRRSST